MMRFIAIAAAAGLALPTTGEARPKETTYYVGHGEKFVNITFESNADLETIVGTTHTAYGKMSVDLTRGVGSVFLAVPVSTLRTGIDVRDEHLQNETWLNAKVFPNISFKSTRSEPVTGVKDRVRVTGNLFVHGQKKEMTLDINWKELPSAATRKAGFGPGRWVKFSTSFDVKLSDFGVKVPDGIVAKVSDTWKVKMVLFASTANPNG